MHDRWVASKRKHWSKPATVHLVDVFPTRLGEQWITACGRLMTQRSAQLMGRNTRKLNRCEVCERVRKSRARSR